MAQWIYCGSAASVDAESTQSLLRNDRAIWCSPPGLRNWPGIPRPGHRLWLVWREEPSSQTVLLLGGGRIEQSPRALFHTNLLWTERDANGLRARAQALGYSGGNAMSFLRVEGAAFPLHIRDVVGIGNLASRLNVATPAQVAALSALLPIA